jgi:hypothetical protein
MLRFLVAAAIILVVLVGWLYVEELYRRFARANPELGPFRSGDAGCSGRCGSCNGGSCGVPEQHSQVSTTAATTGCAKES